MKLLGKINEKFVNKKKKYRMLNIFPNNFFVCILFVFVLFFFINKIAINETTLNYNNELNYRPDLVNKKSYKLDISNIKKTDKISIRVGTYNKRINGLLKVRIYKNNKQVKLYKTKLRKFKNNNYISIDFPLKNINNSDKYTIFFDKTNIDNNIAVFVNKYDYIDAVYSVKSINTIFCIVIFIISLVVFFVLNFFINTRNIDNKIYLLMLASYFLLISILIPPFHAPDEYYHFSQSYGLTQKVNKSKGTSFNHKYSCLMYGKYNLSNNVYSVNDISKCFKKDTSNKKIKLDSRAQSFNIVYLILSVFIRLTLLFTSNPFIVFFVGRIINMVLNLVILYMAIKIIPTHKKSLLLVISIPVFVQQFITYSYDGLTNSLSILLISYILNLKYSDKSLKVKQYCVMAIITSLLMIIKLPYAIFGLMMLIIPSDKFSRNKLLKYAIIMLVFILSFLVYKTYYGLFNFTNHISIEQGNSASIMDLVFSPMYAAKLLANTVFVNIGFYLKTMVGGLDWINVYLSDNFIILIYFLLILVAVSEKNKYSLKDRAFILVISIMLFIGILVALYIGWSSKWAPVIDGVQGRYFLPIILPLMIVFSPKKEKIKLSNNTIQSVTSVIMIIYLLTVLIAYY